MTALESMKGLEGLRGLELSEGYYTVIGVMLELRQGGGRNRASGEPGGNFIEEEKSNISFEVKIVYVEAHNYE